MDPHLESTPMALEGPLQEAVYLALDRCTERRFGRIQVDLSAAHPGFAPQQDLEIVGMLALDESRDLMSPGFGDSPQGRGHRRSR
mgnify:CR=1 FL=1